MVDVSANFNQKKGLMIFGQCLKIPAMVLNHHLSSRPEQLDFGPKFLNSVL